MSRWDEIKKGLWFLLTGESYTQPKIDSSELVEVVYIGSGVTVAVPRLAAAVKPVENLAIGNKTYKDSVLKLFVKTFNLTPENVSSQDIIWRQWLGLGRGGVREPNDLIEIANSDKALAFRARAITILLLPDLRFSPFMWVDNSGIKGWNYLFLYKKINVSTFPDQLKRFIGELVCLNVDAVTATDYNDKLYNSIFGYNKYILQMLAILSEKDHLAERLFNRYHMIDPVGYSGMEECSGYHPFEELMWAEVPETWKWLADKKMHEIVLSEVQGKTKPRHDWEDALSCYAGIVRYYVCVRDRFIYGIDLYISQITFLMNLKNAAKYSVIESRHLRKTLELLDGEVNRELRHRVSRYVVLDTRNTAYHNFWVHDEETRLGAQMVLDEFGDEDTELQERLVLLLMNYRLKEKEKVDRLAEEAARVSEVENQMK